MLILVKCTFCLKSLREFPSQSRYSGVSNFICVSIISDNNMWQFASTRRRLKPWIIVTKILSIPQRPPPSRQTTTLPSDPPTRHRPTPPRRLWTLPRTPSRTPTTATETPSNSPAQTRTHLRGKWGQLNSREGGFSQGFLRSRRLCQWAPKVKPCKLASFQPKSGSVRAIFQESLLNLGCRILSMVHFFLKRYRF